MTGFIPVPNDDAITRECVFVILDDVKITDGQPDSGNQIPFQFPPEITSDGKTTKWDETPASSWEPIAVWQGSSPRRVNIKMTFIITGKKPYTVKGIADICALAKSYFYRDQADVNGTGSPPVILMRIYQTMAGGPVPAWRADSVAVNHSGPVVTQDSASLPLKTEITFDLALITKLDDGDGRKLYEGSTVIPSKPVKEWY